MKKVLTAPLLLVSFLVIALSISIAINVPKDNIRENPYSSIPAGLVDERLESMLGYFATPFASTSFSTSDGIGIFNQEYDLGEASFLGLDVKVRVRYPNEMESPYPCSMTLVQEDFNPYDFKAALESLFGEPLRKSSIGQPGLFYCSIPNSDAVIYFHHGLITIEDTSHPYNQYLARGTAGMLGNSGSAGTGLTKELTDSYDSDGLRPERSYRKYSYYDASGDLVGVKTVWEDGRESDTIFDDHKDEYDELP